jgi:hypothetical protein
VIEFPTTPVLQRPDDLDTIRRRLAEAYYGTSFFDVGVIGQPRHEDDIERYALALNRAMEDLFKLLNYVDQIQEVNGPEDVTLLKGEVPYARVAQVTAAKLFVGANLAHQFLKAQTDWRRLAISTPDPDHNINVQAAWKHMDAAENALRLSHGFPVVK